MGKHENPARGYNPDKAYRRLKLDADALENPPPLVTCNLTRFHVRTNVTATAVRRHDLDLDPLAEPAGFALMRTVFTMPLRLRRGTTKVKVALKDLEKTPFAINAHESKAKIENYIACGDVKGDVKGGKLTVALSELKRSGLEGDATLTDNGDGTTTVVVEFSKKKG